MKSFFIVSLCVLTIFNSCKKSDGPPNTSAACSTLLSVKATPNSTSIARGEKLMYSSTLLFGGSPNSAVTYIWTIPGEGVRTTASDSIVSVDYRHAGWWYAEVKNTCDGVIKKDSFNLNVTIPQGIPSCNNTVNNNVFSFTGFLTGNATFTNTKLQDAALDYNPSEVYFGIQANQPTDPLTNAFGSIVVVFHSQYKLTNLPPSGIYTTSSVAANGHPVFGAGDFDKCYISYVAYNTTAGVVVYKSAPNQSIYITNQNGKLKAVLCNVGLTGTSSLTGLTYMPVATGALAVP
jgi:hypothetical protein